MSRELSSQQQKTLLPSVKNEVNASGKSTLGHQILIRIEAFCSQIWAISGTSILTARPQFIMSKLVTFPVIVMNFVWRRVKIEIVVESSTVASAMRLVKGIATNL